MMALRTIGIGSVGPEVTAVQQGLNLRDGGTSPRLKEDGVFGSNTDRAVRAYQAAHDLVPDGRVGPLTRASLFSIGVATTTIFGMRLTLPSFPSLRFGPQSGNLPSPFSPGTLELPQIWKQGICTGLNCSGFQSLSLPRLRLPVQAPAVPDWSAQLPPLPTPSPSSPGFIGFSFDHTELQPGGQSTFPLKSARQDMFVLTMQNVYTRGPSEGPHIEADLGVQIGTPLNAAAGDGSVWTFNPFVQLTDVDRFGKLGFFHFWQPYAQIGVQFSGPGDPQPSLTANLFPVNLGFDIVDNVLTASVGAGLALTLALQQFRVQAAPQLTFGLSLQFGQPVDSK